MKKIIKNMLILILSLVVFTNSMPINFANAAELNQDNNTATIGASATIEGNKYTVTYPIDTNVAFNTGMAEVIIEVRTLDLKTGAKLVVSVNSDDEQNPGKLAMYQNEDADKKRPIYLRLFNQDDIDKAMADANNDFAVAHTALLKAHDQTVGIKKDYPYNFFDTIKDLSDEEQTKAKQMLTFGILDFLDKDYISRPSGIYRGQLTVSCSVERL